MRKWFIAIYLFSSHKKGISSHQLSRDLSITQKTAWFMLQRIREVMKNDNNSSESGTFEADEAYIGGSESNNYYWVSKKHIQRYINEFVFRYNTKNSKC